ncbi:hypothetical protein HUJ04_013226 [Dendroctonus ponderosae]|nr:hypothetical protein HUJ04_013226 [Dendroctonus ponderosae]
MRSAVVILIHKVLDGQIVSSIMDENRGSPLVIRSLAKKTGPQFDLEGYDEAKVCLNFAHLLADDTITIRAVGEEALESSLVMGLNFPTLTKCQNCETNFPTKYQYQRHQCDFNEEKLVYKNPDAPAEKNERQSRLHECPVCFKGFATKASMEKHHSTCHLGNDSICEFCNKHFVTDNRLRIHKENHCKKAGKISKFYRSDVTVWKCKKCHEVFSSVDNAQHHVRLCQDAAQLLSMDDELSFSKHVETISTEILLQCEFCNRSFSDKNLLLMHQRKHTTAKNYECVNCEQVFDSYTLAASHWIKRCTEFANVFFLPKLSFCEYCDRTFKSHEILYNHKIKQKHYTPKLHISLNEESPINRPHTTVESQKIINRLIQDVLKTLEVPVSSINNASEAGASEIKTEPVSDNSCSASQEQGNRSDKRPKKRKPLRSASKAKKHCLTTDKGFKYQCERCIKVFNSISSLESHRSGEHVATFCCEECGQTLGSAKALLIHCRAHKSLKPYVCDTCGRSYSQTSHLWQHMRFHQGIKPFACPHEGCEARYTIRPDLKDHIRKVHTRERPFKCSVCNKCFLTGSVYYQHRLIHTNDRRYGCLVCGVTGQIS